MGPPSHLPPALPWARPLILLSPAVMLALVGAELGAAPLRFLALGLLLSPLFRVAVSFRAAILSLLFSSALGALLGGALGSVSMRHNADGFFLGLPVGALLGAGWGVVCAQLALGRRSFLEAEARALSALVALVSTLALVLSAIAIGAGRSTSPGAASLVVLALALTLALALHRRRWSAWWDAARAGQLPGLRVAPWGSPEWPLDAPFAFPERAPLGSPRWWSTLFLEHRPSAPRSALLIDPGSSSYRSADAPPEILALLFSEKPLNLGARWAEVALLVAYAMGTALVAVGIGSFALAAVTLVVFSGASTY